jgi:hypothetical protein
MAKSLYRILVDLDKLFALLDRRIEQVQRKGESEREAPEDVVRAVNVATRAVTLLDNAVLPALEKAIEDAKRATDVGRLTLQAIDHCFSTGKQVPESIRKSFVRIYANERAYKSWDRAFGQPRRRANDFKSLGDIERLVHVAKSNGQPIDNDLFEAIGRKLAVGGSTKVKGLYSLLKDGKKPQ